MDNDCVRYDYGNGEWTYSYNECVVKHGQWFISRGSFDYVNYQLISADDIERRNNYPRSITCKSLNIS